jgi:hypothetical protein
MVAKVKRNKLMAQLRNGAMAQFNVLICQCANMPMDLRPCGLVFRGIAQWHNFSMAQLLNGCGLWQNG